MQSTGQIGSPFSELGALALGMAFGVGGGGRTHGRLYSAGSRRLVMRYLMMMEDYKKQSKKKKLKSINWADELFDHKKQKNIEAATYSIVLAEV